MTKSYATKHLGCKMMERSEYKISLRAMGPPTEECPLYSVWAEDILTGEIGATMVTLDLEEATEEAERIKDTPVMDAWIVREET